MNFFLPISMKVSRGIYELFGTNDMGKAGLSELGGRGAIAPPTQILADQLTLSQPGPGGQIVHHITTQSSRFPDLPTSLP